MNMRIPLSLLLLSWSAITSADFHVVVIEGLGGEKRYAGQFAEQVTAIASAAATMTSSDRVTLLRSDAATRDAIVEYFDQLNASLNENDRLAVYLIGHGSYDDHQYKFNLPGPDLTGEELKNLLDANPAGTQLLVNTSSASGALQEHMTDDRRTLILATKSGVERHATRFGGYFVAALSTGSADLDKNSIVTAAEAFQFAERQVADYYERNGQLATEHPGIDGGNAMRFGLARLGSSAPVSVDTQLRELLSERDAINATIEDLRLRRDAMSADEYQNELLENMLDLATLEEEIEQREAQLQE